MQFQRPNGKPDLRQYLGVRCRYCETPILFGRDQSQGSGPIVRSFAKLVLTCSAPDCVTLHERDIRRAGRRRHTNHAYARMMLHASEMSFHGNVRQTA